MQKQKSISILIPSWNSESQLKQNLPYVFAAAKQVEAEVIVVDGGSQQDSSVAYLKSLGDKIHFFENTIDGSFSGNVNKGFELAKGDLVVLLNTDVRPAPDCFAKAVKYFDDPSVYALNLNSHEAWMGGEWSSGLFHHFRVASTDQSSKLVHESLWASGGQGVFDRAKWQALGGMDLLYKPFYWEDTDMGYSAWKRGWKILYAPDCQVDHAHQDSVIASNFTKEFIMATAQRNQFIFIWKNISDPMLILSHILHLPYLIFKFPRALFSALLLLPQVMKQRYLHHHHWVRSDRDILKLWTR